MHPAPCTRLVCLACGDHLIEMTVKCSSNDTVQNLIRNAKSSATILPQLRTLIFFYFRSGRSDHLGFTGQRLQSTYGYLGIKILTSFAGKLTSRRDRNMDALAPPQMNICPVCRVATISTIAECCSACACRGCFRRIPLNRQLRYQTLCRYCACTTCRTRPKSSAFSSECTECAGMTIQQSSQAFQARQLDVRRHRQIRYRRRTALNRQNLLAQGITGPDATPDPGWQVERLPADQHTNIVQPTRSGHYRFQSMVPADRSRIYGLAANYPESEDAEDDDGDDTSSIQPPDPAPSFDPGHGGNRRGGGGDDGSAGTSGIGAGSVSTSRTGVSISELLNHNRLRPPPEYRDLCESVSDLSFSEMSDSTQRASSYTGKNRYYDDEDEYGYY